MEDVNSLSRAPAMEPDSARYIPEETARRYGVAPLRVSGGKLFVAALAPADFMALDDVRFVAGMPLSHVEVCADELARLIDEAYGAAPTSAASMRTQTFNADHDDAASETAPELSGRSPSPLSRAPQMPQRQAPSQQQAPSQTTSQTPLPWTAPPPSNSQGSPSATSSQTVRGGGTSALSSLSPNKPFAARNAEGKPEAVALADEILARSVELSASDIHIEPQDDSVRIRYRVDGVLIGAGFVSSEVYAALSTRVKVLAGMDIAERRLPQDGRIDMSLGGRRVDFRVSTLPTVRGEKIEIRILDRAGFSFDRAALGFTERENRALDKLLTSPHGMILVTGPTGSGKTTTIYTLLSEINRPDRNIVTIEDPVEYIMRGVNQVQVNQKVGITFAGGLRSVLRQDPDVIMVGEIRDEDTAAIAVRSAITGHLVFSTLHTNDAPSAATRLTDMGVEPYLIAEAVSCVIAQRLTRVLCPACKREREASEADKNALDAPDLATVFEPVGCAECGGLGYRGRRAIREVMVMSPELKGAVERGLAADALRDIATREGMTTLYDSCRALVFAGITSTRELAGAAFDNSINKDRRI